MKNLRTVGFYFWITALTFNLLLIVGICSYDRGYNIGARGQQKKDFNAGFFILQNRDARIKQLESALKVYNIEIPRE